MTISPLDVIELLDPTPDELKYALARALEEADEVQVAHDRFRKALTTISIDASVGAWCQQFARDVLGGDAS